MTTNEAHADARASGGAGKGMATGRSVLLFQRMLPAYRVGVFRTLAQQLGIVLCYTPDVPIAGVDPYDTVPDFPHVTLEGGFLLGGKKLFSQKVLTVLRERRPEVVICEFALGMVTFWKLVLLRPFLGYRLIGWMHGIKSRDLLPGRKSLHYRLASLLYRIPDAVILYDEERLSTVRARFPWLEGRSFVAHNTLDTATLLSTYETVCLRSRSAVREELGLRRKHYLVFIGGLKRLKRLDLLFEAYAILKRSRDLGLLIIGDGEERGRIDEIASLDPDVHVMGAIHGIKDSASYLYAADLLVIPGPVGLGIVHGFAFGLPIITCRSTVLRAVHSPEIVYLEAGKNGEFAELEGGDIASRIAAVLDDDARLIRMREAARATFQSSTRLESMVDGFRDAVDFARSLHHSTNTHR
jgi:L-malate glycosyltransferase